MIGTATVSEVTFDRFDTVRAALLNPDLVRSIDSQRFESGNIMERVILMIAGDDHRDRRRIENALFRRETLERFERALFPVLTEETFERAATTPSGDLIQLGGSMAVVVSARIAGIDFDDSDLEERRRLAAYLHLFARGEALDAATGDIERIKREVMAALTAFEAEYFAPSRQRREALLNAVSSDASDQADLPGDILTTLIGARRSLNIDDDLLVRETALFFEAGAHTSTQTFTNSMHHVFGWLAEHREARSRTDDLAWVQRAVHEALRLRPANPLMRRRAIRDTDVAGQPVAAGTHVYLDTAAANRDPAAYGPNAERFDPDRITEPGIPAYGTSFGGGIHLCIGRTLAVGLPQRPGETPDADHLYGFVPYMVRAALRHGVAPHPTLPPVPDPGTRRWTRWVSYPVQLGD